MIISAYGRPVTAASAFVVQDESAASPEGAIKSTQARAVVLPAVSRDRVRLQLNADIAMPTEIELKLYCPPEEIARVVSHPLISAGNEKGAPKRLVNTYFDTPDLALHAERIALRVRDTATERLQTVKCDAESMAGLSSRPEWEGPFTGTFDFTAVDNCKVQALLEARQAELTPVFTTTFERRTWRIDVSKKIALWVMVDVGEISSGDRVLPVSEVELELVQGRANDLLDFGAELATQCPLVPDNVSKAERGYRLFLDQQANPHKAAKSALTAKCTPADSFQILAGQGLQMWQANLLGTLTSTNPEFIHQYRVALRRLGSLLEVFKPFLPGRFQRQWAKQFRKLSQVTGDIRDLDVMRESILANDDENAQKTLSIVLAAWECARQEAQVQLEQLRYGAPVLMFAGGLRELAPEDFPGNLPRLAERQIFELHRKAEKRFAKSRKSPTLENAHGFRIALKHLRYACEFFAPLFEDEEMLRYAKSIAKLQDELGFVNDFHVALGRLRHWVEQGAISKKNREEIAAWHMDHARETLAGSLRTAETVLNRCLPWCTECELRRLSPRLRSAQHEIPRRIKVR